MKRLSLLTICFCLGMFLLTGSLPVWADDVYLSEEIAGVGIDSIVEREHAEGEPFKGWLYLTVENTGSEAWGDFHFQIFQVGTETVENIDFIVADPFQPLSTQSGMTWSVDNDVVGATLDLYFYSDPINPGEIATFNVYTDNTTDKRSYFGVAFYPTPVPVPPAIILLSSGLIGLLGVRRKIGKAQER